MKRLFILLTTLLPLSIVAQKTFDVLNVPAIEVSNGGLKIKTQIPSGTTDHMPVIKIEGTDYYNSSTIGLLIRLESNSYGFISSYGGSVPIVRVGSENSKIILHFNGFLWPTFSITAIGTDVADSNWYKNWSVVDTTHPSGSSQFAYRNSVRDVLSVSGTTASDVVTSPLIKATGYIQGDANTSRGYYTAKADNHFTQNAVYNTSTTWKSFSSKTSNGSAVVLQTLGKSGKALNLMVDTTISAGGEALTFSNLFTVDINGKTGIGSFNPKEILEVNGNITMYGNNKSFRFNTYNSSGNKYLSSGYAATFTLDSLGQLSYANTASSGSADASATLASVFTIDKNGKVGVGTNDTKGYKFAVNGTAVFEKATVKLNANWPDYVFEESYKLPDLKEVEDFIRANKHLEGTPNAAEVEKNGNDLGETQIILLKKVEELTLYLIEINKKVEILAKENERLKKIIENK